MPYEIRLSNSVLEKGDIVITSGEGENTPRGIVVGKSISDRRG